jgi:hypothetical protein
MGVACITAGAITLPGLGIGRPYPAAGPLEPFVSYISLWIILLGLVFLGIAALLKRREPPGTPWFSGQVVKQRARIR